MSENSLAMMPWFPRDFIAATRAMRLAERGAYRDLLDFQWEMGRLPAALDRLAMLLGVSLDEFQSVWPAIKDKFLRTGEYISNQRLEEHRSFALQQRDRKRHGAMVTNAKRSAERPAMRTAEHNGQRTLRAAVAERRASDTPPSPSPSPSTFPREEKEQARKARPASRLPEEFNLTDERRSVGTKENLDVERVFADFCDYWRAASGAKARKMDWDATWRVWCRNQFGRAGNGSKHPVFVAPEEPANA